jgi:hypothetical protein
VVRGGVVQPCRPDVPPQWLVVRAHAIEVGHFVVFKYDGHDMVTVKTSTRPCATATTTPTG